MKYLYLILLFVLAGCVELPNDSDTSSATSEEDPSNIVGPKPDIELVDVDGRFLSSTYRNAILGRSFDDNDLSGTWIRVVSGYGISTNYKEAFFERRLININADVYPPSTEVRFENQCMWADLYIDLETKKLNATRNSNIEQFNFVDGSYFYYIREEPFNESEGHYVKIEFVKLSNKKFNIGVLSEKVFDGSGLVQVDGSNDIDCYKESDSITEMNDNIWRLSEVDIRTEANSHVSFYKPISLYGRIYPDDSVYHLDHESINDLQYEANENEGGEVSLTSSIMHIEGTTRIITESGGITSSRFEISITDIINGE